MLVADSHRRQDAANAARADAARSPPGRLVRLVRGLSRAIVLAAFAGILAFVGGFLWFVAQVPTGEVVLDRNAEAAGRAIRAHLFKVRTSMLGS